MSKFLAYATGFLVVAGFAVTGYVLFGWSPDVVEASEDDTRVFTKNEDLPVYEEEEELDYETEYDIITMDSPCGSVDNDA